MDVALQGEDVKDWVYRGEGAANLILSYNGSSPSMLGKVLRVRKVLKDRKLIQKKLVVLSKPALLIWGEVAKLSVDQSQDCLEQAYATVVLSKYLGVRHIDAGVRVFVSRDFLALVAVNVVNNRPAWRCVASEIDTSAVSARLISDHSVFSGMQRELFSVAVEIKPKCGFLPSSEYISEETAAKKCVNRYRMHQLVKLHKGEIANNSEYDPLDLFSHTKERICKAVRALFSTPQNNFRIFINGSLTFGAMEGGVSNVNSEQGDRVVKDLVRVFGLQLSDFIDLVTETIYKSDVLERLLTTQKLDVLDIEGAIHVYYNIISQPCLVCKTIVDPELLRRCSYLHSLALEESTEIVRNYLISATAKDCSLMLSFSPGKDGVAASGHGSVYLESLKKSFDYKAYFVDLDMKPIEKMEHYYKLDQEIVNYYTKVAQAGESAKKASNGSCSNQGTNQHCKNAVGRG